MQDYKNRVFTHVAGNHENLLEEKKVFTWEKISNPTGLVLNTNVASVYFFYDTNNVATVTSCKSIV